MSKFSAKLTPAGFSFNLVADNNEIIATSQVYSSKGACLKGIESVQTNAPYAPVEDQTVKDFALEENPKFEVFKDKGDKFRFRLKAENGEIIAASQAYKAKPSCLNGIESVRNNAAYADIVAEDVFAEMVVCGNIFTGKDKPKAQALAIFGGYIVYVGDAEGVKELIGKKTEVVTIEGGIILPAVGGATTTKQVHQLLCDGKLDGIAYGKEANLIVLEQDITACEPDKVSDAPFARTMAAGKWTK